MKIMPSDYMLFDKERGLDVQECEVGFAPTESEDWVFGSSFTRNFFTIYDSEDSRIGFIPNGKLLA